MRPTTLIHRFSDEIGWTCDGGGCNRPAVSMAYDSKVKGLIPVCRRHLNTYQVCPHRPHHSHIDCPRLLWACEDEWVHMKRAHTSRSRWLARWKVLIRQWAVIWGLT